MIEWRELGVGKWDWEENRKRERERRRERRKAKERERENFSNMARSGLNISAVNVRYNSPACSSKMVMKLAMNRQITVDANQKSASDSFRQTND